MTTTRRRIRFAIGAALLALLGPGWIAAQEAPPVPSASAMPPRPSRIHEGSRDAPGPVVHPLEDVAAGRLLRFQTEPGSIAGGDFGGATSIPSRRISPVG